ncbi:MAG: hypothetical protein HYZ29_33935 [Myxococcales bacterium]|nr:hypothetical protein [Myxococcales bacterium]
MTEPKRLLDVAQGTPAHALIVAGLDDHPAPGAAGRALAALALSAAAPGAAGSAGGASAASKGAIGAQLSVLAKWGAGAAVVASLGAMANAARTPEGVGARLHPILAKVAKGAAPPRVAPEIPVAPATRSVPPRESTRASPREGKASVPASDSLELEVALVSSARQALSRGDSGAALGLLDRYQREFPAGRLRPEALVLRVEALVRAGKADRARELARGYLAQSPGGAHASRLRELVGP